MLCYSPSLIAASAIFLAKFILVPTKRPWNSTLRHYTQYEPSELHDCVLALHSLCCNNHSSNLPAIREKYSQHKDLLSDSCTPESEHSLNPPSQRSENMSNMNEIDVSNTTPFPGFVETSSQISSTDLRDTMPRNLDIRTARFAESKKTELRLTTEGVSEDNYQRLPSKVARLSNKERLLLRKQALMVKKRPLFSINQFTTEYRMQRE